MKCTWQRRDSNETLCSNWRSEHHNKKCSERCETPTSKTLDQTRGYMKIITEEQLLKLTGDELSRVAGEVLQIKSNCYNCSHLKNRDICKATLPERNRDGCNAYKPDPIPLTWQEAMKHFNKALEKHGKKKLIEAMKKVYISVTGDTNGANYVMDWWAFNAGITGNLMAAVVCEING